MQSLSCHQMQSTCSRQPAVRSACTCTCTLAGLLLMAAEGDGALLRRAAPGNGVRFFCLCRIVHLMPQALQSSLRRVGPGRHVGVSTGRPVNRVSSGIILSQHMAAHYPIKLQSKREGQPSCLQASKGLVEGDQAADITSNVPDFLLEQ